MDKRITQSNLRLKEKVDSKNGLLAKFKGLAEEEFAIREKELTIATLYEVTKRMSAMLRLSDIFNVLSAFLKENFIFRRSELIILKEPRDLVAARHEVWAQDGTRAADDAGVRHDELMNLFAEEMKEAYMDRKDNSDLFERLGLSSGVTTFGAVPLLSEKRKVGILTVENILPGDFERFVILAMQFSLELKKVLLYETVEELAITDDLTGLYVRRYFFERLNEELNRSMRRGYKFAYLMMDIDDFKNCNDRYGHLVGDVILKGTAHLIRESTREIDLVARYGGEEFSCLLPETDREGARRVAERIRKGIEENVFRAYDEKLKVTISTGIAVYPEDADNPRGLVEKADRAMYEAKRLGKNIVYA